jgi:hypothetical protein
VHEKQRSARVVTAEPAWLTHCCKNKHAHGNQSCGSFAHEVACEKRISRIISANYLKQKPRFTAMQRAGNRKLPRDKA